MPLDAVCLRAIVNELRPQLIGARVDKVTQPSRERVILHLRGGLRLLCNAGPNQPRLHFTATEQENPPQPPMFCMLLRKHLIGARILSVEQPDLERIVILTLHATDELGQSGERRIILEAMGRRANLVLTDGDGRILDCLRRTDFDAGGDRALLPGLFYRLPKPLERTSPLAEDAASALSLAAYGAEERIDDVLVRTYLGLSPLVAREIVQRAAGRTDLRFCELSDAERMHLDSEIADWINIVKQDSFTPTICVKADKPIDFTYLSLTQYGGFAETQTRESFSALLDEFYDLRERQEIAAQRGKQVLRAATTARERMVRKLDALHREYTQTQDRDTLRLCGDLITANLYRIEAGEKQFTAENYYAEGNPPFTITLDPTLTPQANAAKYYKRYRKAKSAETHLSEQIAAAERECRYLESVLEEIARAETEEEFSAIRAELQEAGYLKNSRAKNGKKPRLQPKSFRSSGGFRILVGRNNAQNDALTKQAERHDLWLHTQKIHGSHVILCTGGLVPPEQDIAEAAMLAAFFSQAQAGENVPVDFTPVKNVKKPAGARPGMVIYTTYHTLYVTPDAAAVKRLESK